MDVSRDSCCGEVRRGILLPICHICNQVPEKGIRGGIRVKKAFICTKCEQEMVFTKVGTHAYMKLLEKIKQIFK
jgi:hypothetical protein